MRRYWCVVLLLIVACTQPTTNEVTIGFIGPLTGSSSILGQNLEMGVMLAVDEINKQGGIAGKPLHVTFADGQCTAKGAVNALQRLLFKENPVAVIVSCSPEVLGVAPILEEKKIVGFSSFATNPKIKHAGEYIFRNVPNDELQARIAAELIAEAGHDRVAIFHLQHDYGVGLKDALIAELSDSVSVVAVEVHEAESANMRTQLTKIKEADPDALYLIAFPLEGARILKQATELGLAIPIYAAEALKDPTIIHDATNYKGDILITVPNGEGPNYATFLSKFTQHYGREPGIYAAEAYDGVLILQHAMLTSDGSATGIKNALSAMKPFIGASGVTTFDAYGEISEKPYDFFTIENSTFVKRGVSTE
ncbi:MAG: ABC transporter substrate-binding protein [Candidatus Woesearchaeota archaeon]|nr:ABC transporter substrate-binding protein [Candidatus Woesearchaeota archaeon]